MVGRNTTTAFKNEVAGDVIRPHILIDAEFSSGTIYVWDGDYDLTWNSNTYLGAGQLLEISPIGETTETKVNDLTISFTGIDSNYKTFALSQVDLDNDVAIRFALLDSSGSVVADPETVFKGKMDEVKLSESAGTSVFELAVQNKLAILRKANSRRYTNRDQQELHAGDTGLRHMVNSEREIRWGSTV